MLLQRFRSASWRYWIARLPPAEAGAAFYQLNFGGGSGIQFGLWINRSALLRAIFRRRRLAGYGACSCRRSINEQSVTLEHHFDGG